MKPNWNLGHTPRPGKHPAWIYRVPEITIVLHSGLRWDPITDSQCFMLPQSLTLMTPFNLKTWLVIQALFLILHISKLQLQRRDLLVCRANGAPAGAETSWLQAMWFALYSREVALNRVYSFRLLGELVKTKGEIACNSCLSWSVQTMSNCHTQVSW